MTAEVDERRMALALSLAENGLYSATPNPRVGCVVFRGGEVVGRGWHRAAGEAHAEVVALSQAGANARREARCMFRWSRARMSAGRRRASTR